VVRRIKPVNSPPHPAQSLLAYTLCEEVLGWRDTKFFSYEFFGIFPALERVYRSDNAA